MSEQRPFRGQQRWGDDKGKWAFGSFLTLGLRCYIVPIPPPHETPADDITLLAQITEGVEVIPESVGQSTGRMDKTAKESYRGDRIKSRHYDGIGEIVWRGNGWVVKVKGDTLLYSLNYEFTIIGTIHDKPELLQETDK